MIENFSGSPAAVRALQQMVEQNRIPQTILLAGSEGVGKATLARRFAAGLLATHPGEKEKIEQDDLSLAHNLEYLAEREKWPADKRTEDPLFFATHPDFVTFAPDGPLRQISIQQTRLLKEHSQFNPSKGSWRVFLIDQVDRAGEQAANSLLKTLEEPPEHLILLMTAENPYDLLPTIRSRSVILHLAPLSDEEMRRFVKARQLDEPERRISLAQGSPGVACSLDLEVYDRRRSAMLALLKVAAGVAPFSTWLKPSESVSGSKLEKLDHYLKVLYILLEDLLLLQHGTGRLRNPDIEDELKKLAGRLSFTWIQKAVKRVDELTDLLRRNIQKSIALDALILEMRAGQPLAGS